MKAVLEKTPRAQWESFHCEVVRGASYNALWHFHPEYQLTLVLRSRGHRMVGDNITPLRPGDLVLVGSNLPHVWHQAASGGSSKLEARSSKTTETAVHAIIVRFLDSFLGAEFLEKPELESVRQLLRRSARGLAIGGKTREIVAEKMHRLAASRGLARIVELLAILELLAASRELRPVASAGFVPAVAHADQDRMQRVCRYIDAHLTEPIERDAVAAEAHLSPGAFSRFFRVRTGKTLPEYVNALRIGRACEQLAEGTAKVTDIAMDCGFRNLANFNRHFRALTKLAPREYRRRFLENAA
jgi:AraC-like DNA-binding protein/mannose-6-phosphate isomerase-like protein (cupin superfamily)